METSHSAKFAHKLLKDYMLVELREELEKRNSGIFIDWTDFKKEIFEQTIGNFKFYISTTFHESYVQLISILKAISNKHQGSTTDFNIWCQQMAETFYYKVFDKYKELRMGAITFMKAKQLVKQIEDLGKIGYLFKYEKK